jgi:predicted ATPase/DNA-binding SARP family transcriptional activator
VEFRVLGRTQVLDGGRELAIGGAQRRALLAALLVDANAVVPVDRLVDVLWPMGAPMSAAQTVQSHVSQLRKLLGPARIVTEPRGYRVVTDGAQLDAAEFEGDVEVARRQLSSDPAAAVASLERALGRWRGRAFDDADGSERAAAEAARLEDLRASAVELLLEARLATGDHDRVAADAEAALAEWPLRERIWGMRMLALYRAGRQAEALAAYQDVRSALAEELGLDPSPELQELEGRILRHDPAVREERSDGTRARMPSGVVTFLLTDVVGSTRLWETAPAAMADALQRHDAIIGDAVRRRDGVLVKARGEGDSTFSVFQRATDAAEAALDAWAALRSEPWPGPAAIEVRMAIHAGEAHERDGDYYGRAVNRVARLRAVAEPSEILLSRAAADLVVDHLGPETTLVEVGRTELRDLDRDETVFVLRRGDGAALPPVRRGRPDRSAGNLPSRTTSLIGRERETDNIVAALRSNPLVTIIGVGGVGKTRLAVHVAAEVADEFPDGVWLCELAAADMPDALYQVVAATLGVPDRPGVDLVDGLAEFLRAKQLLLVLDNCEHLLRAAGDLADVALRSCPGVRIVATSREGLAVDGEQVVPLRSLDVPSPASSVAESAAASAVRLFVERARAAGADVDLDGPDLGGVVEICRRLDGVPLAIELAAARAAAMSPGDIAAHLDERFRLLSGGRRVAVERHQTLRAAVDWSYGLLDERDRAVFARLGVFAGTFDLAAVEAVVTDDTIAAWEAVDAVTSLVAKSMVVADRSPRGALRYRLLETMRQYAKDRLDESGTSDLWRRRHAAHYAGFAEDAGPGLLGCDELAWRDRVVDELDNLRAAVTWGLDRDDADDARLAVRIVARLSNEGVMRRSSGINAWSHRALERADVMAPAELYDVRNGAAWDLDQSGDIVAARDLALRTIADGAPAGTTCTAGPYIALGTSASMLGDLAAGREAFAAGRVVARGRSDETFSTSALLAADAMALAGHGHCDEARASAEAALRLARQLRNPTVLVLATFAMGWSLLVTDPTAARAALEECIALSNAGALDGTAGAALARVAPLRLADGDVDGALDALTTGLARLREIGDRTSLASILHSAAAVLEDLGESEAALTACAVLERSTFAEFVEPSAIQPGRREAVVARFFAQDPTTADARWRHVADLSDDEALDELAASLVRVRPGRVAPA